MTSYYKENNEKYLPLYSYLFGIDMYTQVWLIHPGT